MTTNATKFDEYLIYWKCYTAAQKDGCCMVESANGAICTIDQTADGTVMTTYRLKSAEWTAAVASFATNQASITDAIDGTANAK